MSKAILKITKLTKEYKGKQVVKEFNMTINKGDIYALIGKNGAGKTTLIRMISGVAKPTSGEIELFGETNEVMIKKNRHRMGTLIETPSLFMDMSAYENLNINRMQKGIKDIEAIDRVMNIVGLSHVGNKKVKNYSLGMRQRLGIAKSLLGNPEFLILDEPINGLDPMGIIEMRELFITLNKEYGVTILICSHILKELEMVATKYGIINDGNLVEEISAEELNKKCNSHIVINVDDVKACEDILKNILGLEHVEIASNNELKIFNSKKDSGDINRVLVQAGLTVNQIKIEVEDVEIYFSKVIGGIING